MLLSALVVAGSGVADLHLECSCGSGLWGRTLQFLSWLYL